MLQILIGDVEAHAIEENNRRRKDDGDMRVQPQDKDSHQNDGSGKHKYQQRQSECCLFLINFLFHMSIIPFIHFH